MIFAFLEVIAQGSAVDNSVIEYPITRTRSRRENGRHRYRSRECGTLPER